MPALATETETETETETDNVTLPARGVRTAHGTLAASVRTTNRSRSRLQSVMGLMLAMALALSSTDAGADGRTTFLAERLKADDFRVRTNAALALGATADEAAVPALCGALSDSNDVVRQSAAAALKRLAKRPDDSRNCLKSRLAIETNDAVKLQLNRAIESLPSASPGSGGSAPAFTLGPPPFVANAKYYVSISSITNSSGRPQAEVDKIVLGAMRARFDSLGKHQLAPSGETREQAVKVMASRKITKGYYLSVTVSAFDYSGGNLKVTLQVAVASYPGKAILASMSPNAMIAGTSPGNRGAEDQLMEALAASAVNSFANNFQ